MLATVCESASNLPWPSPLLKLCTSYGSWTTSVLPTPSPGDMLVAENVGPRWTPLIPILGGLVLDGGAVGQHHTITAREYGVPAVVGTRNAPRRIPDGT
jgi:phosphohistidine swiveling domain-containing protein